MDALRWYRPFSAGLFKPVVLSQCAPPFQTSRRSTDRRLTTIRGKLVLIALNTVFTSRALPLGDLIPAASVMVMAIICFLTVTVLMTRTRRITGIAPLCLPSSMWNTG